MEADAKNVPRALFPKSARLLNSVDFRRVTTSGRRFGGRFFLLFALETSGPSARVGLTVSRKVGKAVVRNRVKRHVREFFRLSRHTLNASQDWVVIARPQAGRVEADLLRRDLQKIFSMFTKPL